MLQRLPIGLAHVKAKSWKQNHESDSYIRQKKLLKKFITI